MPFRPFFPNTVSLRSRQLIKSGTELCSSQLVPELKLHVLTPKLPLWHQPYDGRFGTHSDPFWSIFWPGGQALSRYIFDQHTIFRGKRILDLGCGSGAVGLAAIKCDARLPVTFNDIDPLALESVVMNAEVNQVAVATDVRLTATNLLDGCPIQHAEHIIRHFDVVFIGDMFYDETIGARLQQLAGQVASHPDKLVLVGDPGRHALRSSALVQHFLCLAKYRLPDDIVQQNFGFTDAFVFRYSDPHQLHCDADQS